MEWRCISLSLALMAFPTVGWGDIITLPTTGTVETFDSQVGAGHTLGPVLLPSGLIFTAVERPGVTNGGPFVGTGSTGTYGLGGNGQWLGLHMAAVDGSAHSITFELPATVAAVSGFLNYSPDDYGLGTSPPMIAVFGSAFNLLESWDLQTYAPISTPGGVNAGDWRGIARAHSEIKYVTFSNAYLAVDRLTFGGAPAPVPEPGSLLLFGSGAAVLAWRRRPR